MLDSGCPNASVTEKGHAGKRSTTNNKDEVYFAGARPQSQRFTMPRTAQEMAHQQSGTGGWQRYHAAVNAQGQILSNPIREEVALSHSTLASSAAIHLGNCAVTGS
jgi:hypothetical protein